MKDACRFIALLFGVVVNLPFSAAQAAPSSTKYVISQFLLSAKSKNEYLNDFASADLQIKENGHLVQRQELKKLNDARMRYCILFDTSNSAKSDFKVEQELALEILQQTINPDTDSGWLVVVNTQPIPQYETHDPKMIGQTIVAARPGGGTAIYDAITQCAQAMAGGLRYPLRRVMFIFSDGEDDTSKVSAEVASQSVLKAGLRVYVIYPPTSTHKDGRSFLQQIANATGGELFATYNEKDPGFLPLRLKNELQNLILVTYEANPPGKEPFRHVELKCKKKGVRVFAPNWIYLPN